MELILTHSNTDFDALASLVAAARLFPGALPVLPHRLNQNLRDFMAAYEAQLPLVLPDALPREPVARIILVDTQQVPALPVPVGPFHPSVEIIDHHPLARELEENEHWLGATAGATTTLLVGRLLESGESVTPLEANLFLLGIYEDTGSLCYPGTTAADLRVAAWLIDQGANLYIAADFLTRPLTQLQLQLYNQLVANAVVHQIHGWPIVITWARSQEYVEEISTLAHRLMDLFDPAGLFLVAQLGETVQLVARSKGPSVSAAAVMAHFGGGGHSRAAAAHLVGRDAVQVRDELYEVLQEKVVPELTAAEIMTRRLHTLAPEATLADAREVMARYGHGALPVVDGRGGLVGLLTRRQLDQALHHGLEREPVATYMWRGPLVIPPDMPAERVRQTMVGHDVGRLLVVDAGKKLLGIITRTDLLRLWPESAPREEGLVGDWVERLEQVLPQITLDLLHEAGQVAEEKKYSLYVVGGFVRDLLLGLSNLDLDLVVEGDAIMLARELAVRLGGRVRSHRRFGTAKWILDNKGNGLPPHLDFVTARTEFYEKPTALPTVEFSSLRQDLYRRDFTINTLAIGLSGSQYGRLFDFYGGKRDMERKLIRVLHNLSFVEDPTRILRAVRLEQRLGFTIEPRTLQLLHGAVHQGLIERTTGERIRHELFLILQEVEPERALARLDELHALRHLAPHLQWDDWLTQRFQRARRETEGEERTLLYLALLTYRLPEQEVEAMIARYRFRSRSTQLLRQVMRLRREVISFLSSGPLSPSQVYRLLQSYSPQSLRLLLLAEDNTFLCQAVELFLERLRFIHTSLNGNDLRAMGLPPGPLYRRLLEALLEARLDGRVHSRAEEEALLTELLAVERILPSSSEANA